MRTPLYTIYACAGAALLGFAGSAWTVDAPAAGTHVTTADIAGTYELIKRVMSDGILAPAIGALYSMNHALVTLNLFFKEKDGSLASESIISRYRLTAGEYCEWSVFTLRNNR